MLVRFVLLCVLLGGSIAQASAPSSNSDTITRNFEELIKKFSSDLNTRINDFFENAKWIVERVDSIILNVLKGGVLDVGTWAFDMVGRLEFLTMADGSHFMVSLGGKNDVEQQYKTVSIAVSKLLRNLKSMERTDKLLSNVSRVVVENIEHQKNMNLTSEKFAQNILHLYIENMDNKFETDEVLAEEYKRQKTLAKVFVKRDPKMRESLFKLGELHKKLLTPEEMTAFLKDKNVLREAFVNKMFLRQSVKHFEMIFNSTHHTRYLMARALIQTAQSSDYESKVNEVYQKALVQTRPYTFASTKDGHPFDVMDALFNSIEKGLASDPTLHKEIQALMKQNEANSDFGITDIFHIDFSPL